jgi:nucleoside-diphosphate-sugar epimerase
LLVFFDNVYAYDLVEGSMTEESPHKPVSKKGEVRAAIADRLMGEYSSGRLQAMIVRSAEFYGPGAEKNGFPNLLIVDRLLSGKSPQWTVEIDKPHSLTYTSDCGRALPLLVADPSAYNQVWHLPTAHPPITLRRFIELAAEAAGVKTKPSFDSSKFAEHSSLSPTPYERGIAETVEYHRKLKG